jgi:hypothetical protein
MNDCINMPDRRLHQTQSSKPSNHPLHRGSHPQRTSPATTLGVVVTSISNDQLPKGIR